MQYTRTFGLPCLLFEFFHLFNFLITGIIPVVLMETQNANKDLETFNGSAVFLYHNSVLSHFALISFYHLNLFAIYMNQELFKVFSLNDIHCDRGN